ncbi:DUF6318 family protein [Arthrobacter psychrochitiniphilus]|nr:DUF6318 family protein [Arthrobacter psychrochitiniphilus]NYG17080.1 hypothetical protein [Arthrobacter psychrochitiniphilus]
MSGGCTVFWNQANRNDFNGEAAVRQQTWGQAMRHTEGGRPGGRRAILGLSVISILILVGCSSAPKEMATSSPGAPTVVGSQPAITSEPAPTPAVYKPATDKGPAENVPVPVLPDKATEFTKDGLIAFAEYWYSTLGYVYETGGSGPMMEITEPACKPCIFVNQPIAELYESGGWIAGGRMTVHQSTASFEQTPDGTYQVILMIQQAQVRAYDANKILRSERPQGGARANIVVARFIDNHWQAQTAEAVAKQ